MAEIIDFRSRTRAIRNRKDAIEFKDLVMGQLSGVECADAESAENLQQAKASIERVFDLIIEFSDWDVDA